MGRGYACDGRCRTCARRGRVAARVGVKGEVVNVLAGLSLNALLGWWWADPAAALVIAAYAAWTGWTTWRESGERERTVVAGGRR